MKNKRNLILIALAVLALFWFLKPKNEGRSQSVKEVKPHYGPIERSISATGAVQPQNRLEMKPPVAGRIDSILVKEGQEVKTGQEVARMSSTERAALVDAAQSKSEDEKKYWEDIYKPIPLIAPIDGTVIVSTMQPGQTVAQSDPVVVLSDRLIVQAQVDETDIGHVEEGQKAVITLDAYPEIRVDALVGHIYHESQVVNNVTIYKVDVIPSEVPAVFRSGMSANVRVVEKSKDNALLVPSEAVKRREGKSFVLLKRAGRKPEKQEVETGISDEANTEIISGVEEKDTLLIVSQKFVPKSGASNPFMPQGGQRRQGGGNAQR